MSERKKKVISKSKAVIPTDVRTAVRLKHRGTINKAVNQKALREKLGAANHIGKIGLCLKRLEAMSEYTAKRRVLDRGEQAKLITETGILKTRLDSHFRLLNKYLPDLRSIDFQNEDGNNPLEAAMIAWSRALDQ